MTLRRFALVFAAAGASAFALACGSHATPPPTVATTAPSTTTNAAREHAYRSAAGALAHDVNAPRDSIAGVSQDEMTWRDSCLGCPKTGESCTQVLTPGYRVVMRIGDASYEYHTDLGGTARLCNQSPAPPAGYAAAPGYAPPPAPTP
jgi:hypothetical protein